MAAWVMRRYPKPWFFAGGWAIDLFLGRRRRWHKDVDLAVFRSDQTQLRLFLDGRKPRRLANGEFVHWRLGDSLVSPEFQVFTEPWASFGLDWEFLLEDGNAERWVFRKDPRIWLPAEQAYLMTPDGVPYLAPEIVLLFKASPSTASSNDSATEELGRLNDEEDFRDAQSAMGERARAWLAESVALAYPEPALSW